MKDSYLSIDRSYRNEIKVNASKFIATLIPILDRNDAETKLSQIRKTYRDATHNCYAFIDTEHNFRYSDDGEPSGTAGKVIYDTLKAQQLEKALLVVTRYFGGTKLGTGGLIRAYSDAAETVIQLAEIQECIIRVGLKLHFEYDQTNRVMHNLKGFDAIIKNTTYQENVEMEIEIKQSEKQLFIQAIFEASHGKIRAK